MTTTSGFNPDVGKATQWRKGQPSANPGGRPKSRLVSDALRAKLAEIASDDPQGRTYAEVLAANLVSLACSHGRSAVAAAAEIADRCEGKPHQEIAVSDVTEQIRQRPTEDLRFFLENGR